MHWYTAARSNSLLSDFVTLYALELISSRFGDKDIDRYKEFYVRRIKNNLIDAILQAAKDRANRVANRIKYSYETHEPNREYNLVHSGVLDDFPWLKKVLLSDDVGEHLKTLSDYKKFYQQLWSDEINEVYPRGARNNRPWVNIINQALKVENASTPSELIIQIDILKDLIHNVNESVLHLIPNGRKLIEFFNLTADNDPKKLYTYMVKHMDTNVVEPRLLKEALGV